VMLPSSAIAKKLRRCRSSTVIRLEHNQRLDRHFTTWPSFIRLKRVNRIPLVGASIVSVQLGAAIAAPVRARRSTGHSAAAARFGGHRAAADRSPAAERTNRRRLGRGLRVRPCWPR
jgi:hypothetical protein